MSDVTVSDMLARDIDVNKQQTHRLSCSILHLLFLYYM